jgi:hypothetical protein
MKAAYEGCLCHAPAQAWVASEWQAGIPVTCKGVQFDEGFRADILIDRQPIVEIKAVASIVPAHDAQVLMHLRMSGLLCICHARQSNDGLPRFVVWTAPCCSVVLRGLRVKCLQETSHRGVAHDIFAPAGSPPIPHCASPTSRPRDRCSSLAVGRRKPSAQSYLRTVSDSGHLPPAHRRTISRAVPPATPRRRPSPLLWRADHVPRTIIH